MYSFYLYTKLLYKLSHTHTLFMTDLLFMYLFVHLFMKHHTSLGHIVNVLYTEVVKSAGWGQNPSFHPDSASYLLCDLG